MLRLWTTETVRRRICTALKDADQYGLEDYFREVNIKRYNVVMRDIMGQPTALVEAKIEVEKAVEVKPSKLSWGWMQSRGWKGRLLLDKASATGF